MKKNILILALAALVLMTSCSHGEALTTYNGVTASVNMAGFEKGSKFVATPEISIYSMMKLNNRDIWFGVRFGQSIPVFWEDDPFAIFAQFSQSADMDVLYPLSIKPDMRVMLGGGTGISSANQTNIHLVAGFDYDLGEEMTLITRLRANTWWYFPDQDAHPNASPEYLYTGAAFDVGVTWRQPLPSDKAEDAE